MTQFVDDDPEFVAIFSNGNSLCSVSPFADKRTASENYKLLYNECLPKLKCYTEAQYLPASAFRENDKMGMIGRTLNKFDAGKVFPVAHGLFK